MRNYVGRALGVEKKNTIMGLSLMITIKGVKKNL